MAVRSNYIKKLMETKDSLEKEYQDVITESMKNIIGENTKDEVRKLLKEAEDEDSFEEEEVENDAATTDDDEVIDTEDEVDSAEDDGDETDDELWDDLENCKSADGEYDCRGMDDGKLLKILKAMGPEDGIRVMSNGDGTVAVEVDGDLIDGNAEYIIDLDDFEDEDKDVEDDVDDELEDEDFEDEDDVDDVDDDTEVELELNEENLGYTDSYQHKTAMTVDSNRETANPRTTYSMDDGVPTGTEKPWAQDGDRQPYDKNVNEDVDECGSNIFEVELEDEEMVDEASHTVTQNNGNVRGVTKSFPTNSSSQQTDRNGAPEAQSPTTGKGRGTGDGYKEATNESVDFKKKVNKLWEENKQMKSIIPELNKKLTESIVINASMGYIVRLLNENSTTVDEKKQISERFAKVNTLEEGKKLYETISNELKQINRSNGVNGIMNQQLAEGKQTKKDLVETTMYKSEKVNEALDFMKRLDSIK